MADGNRIIRQLSFAQQPTAVDGFEPGVAERIMQVFASAKGIMRASGNDSQWSDGYPSMETVKADVERGGGYVVEDDGLIVAYFALLPSPEPTYGHIYNGAWIDDSSPYHVVHRMASVPEAHGIFRSIIDYCFTVGNNIRIDTHRDNSIMQHNILKHGFRYCGIILLANGDERLAFQRIITPQEDYG